MTSLHPRSAGAAGASRGVIPRAASRARWFFGALALAAAALLASAAYLTVRAEATLWLPDYVRHLLAARPAVEGTRHLLFVFVDHYEPGRGEAGVARNREWLDAYRALAARHRDSYGRRPQHTWFYPYDHRNGAVVRDLSRAVHEGLGEIELHLHHGNDSNETFPPKLREALAWFRSHGAMVSARGTTSFAFIHGNWALDDSRTKDRCGVSRELSILKEAGCYADFTFPSAGNPSQPRKVNSIYYAFDDDGPKSYDRGVDAAVGARVRDALLIFEGPIALKLGWYFTDAADVETGHAPTPARVDRWVGAGIGVQGRPEWVFVKIHTHGVQSRGVVFGGHTDEMLTYLEERYGRGAWRLHYVTAREAYNVVRAAEDGHRGDPEAYRDYEIERPLSSVKLVE